VLDELHQGGTATTLRAAARWLGIGVAAVPVIDIADRAGLIVLLTSPRTLEAQLVAVPLLQIGLFVAVGFGASAVLRRHRPHCRVWFFVGCVVPVIAYALASGLGLSAAIAGLALGFAFMQLRLARHAEPIA